MLCRVHILSNLNQHHSSGTWQHDWQCSIIAWGACCAWVLFLSKASHAPHEAVNMWLCFVCASPMLAFAWLVLVAGLYFRCVLTSRKFPCSGLKDSRRAKTRSEFSGTIDDSTSRVMPRTISSSNNQTIMETIRSRNCHSPTSLLTAP